MTNKELILDCLIQDDEAFTQIVEYFELDFEVKISPLKIKTLLDEMIKEGYISINYTWQNEHNEYPYSLTEKGKIAWENIQQNAKDKKYIMIKIDEIISFQKSFVLHDNRVTNIECVENGLVFYFSENIMNVIGGCSVETNKVFVKINNFDYRYVDKFLLIRIEKNKKTKYVDFAYLNKMLKDGELSFCEDYVSFFAEKVLWCCSYNCCAAVDIEISDVETIGLG